MADDFRVPGCFYPIVDPAGGAADHVALASAVLDAGARLLQLRIKNRPTGELVAIARAVKELSDRAGARLIINDRADVARLVDAAGVHVGQDDLPAAAARAVVGPERIVGVSTHNLAQALQVERDGVADYIGFGPVFPTASKDNPDPVQGVEALGEVCRRVHLPVVAIGGIGRHNARDTLLAGAAGVAVIGEIAHACDVKGVAGELVAICGSVASAKAAGEG